MLSLLASVALAQQGPFTTDLGAVLLPSASPLTARGIGSPTLAYDEVDETYVMFFETRLDDPNDGGADNPNCPNGRWAIGAASSQDGTSWDVWSSYVVEPTANTPYSCVAAHPAVLYDAGVFHLWFKAEQGTNFSGTPAWGTTNYSGVGYASVDLSLDDKTVDIALVDQQIADLDQLQVDAVTAFDAVLSTYRTRVRAQVDEFYCTEFAPVCAACGSQSLSVDSVAPRSDSHNFCQTMQFNVPDLTPVFRGANRSTTVQLSWTTPQNRNRTCTYTSGNNPPVPTTQVCNGGLSIGQATSARGDVFLNISHSGGGASKTVTLVDGSLGNVITGPLMIALQTLRGHTSVGDVDGTQALLDAWLVELADMESWLSIAPQTPDELLLLTYTQDMITATQDLQTYLNDTDAQLAALQTERQDLVNYTQHLTPSVMSTGVALQLNTTFGYPTVAIIDGQFEMLLQQYPNLYRASGAAPDALTLDPTPVMRTTQASWASREIYEPSMFCDPGSPFPYGLWHAGRQRTPAVNGAADAYTDDVLSWLIALVPAFTWSDAEQFRHFDVVADANGELRMYYVNRVAGLNEVHLQTTTPTWTRADTLNRVCVP